MFKIILINRSTKKVIDNKIKIFKFLLVKNTRWAHNMWIVMAIIAFFKKKTKDLSIMGAKPTIILAAYKVAVVVLVPYSV